MITLVALPLLRALRLLKWFVAPPTVNLPILQHVALCATTDQITLAATDLRSALCLTVPTAPAVPVVPFTALVTLADLTCLTANGGPIQIDNRGADHLTVRQDGRTRAVATMSDDEFPPVPALGDTPMDILTIDAGQLAAALAQVSLAARRAALTTPRGRHALRLSVADAGQASLTAADSVRPVACRLHGTHSEPATCLLPLRTWQGFADLLTTLPPATVVTLRHTAGRVGAQGPAWRFTAFLMDES